MCRPSAKPTAGSAVRRNIGAITLRVSANHGTVHLRPLRSARRARTGDARWQYSPRDIGLAGGGAVGRADRPGGQAVARVMKGATIEYRQKRGEMEGVLSSPQAHNIPSH